jgi:RNA polymerase sigma-70 factor, ECF subfamily
MIHYSAAAAPAMTHATPRQTWCRGPRDREGGAARGSRLVRLIAGGDRAAFAELYRRTAPWLAVRLRRRCADDELVAEVMQETYLAVWRAAAFAGASVGGTAVGWLWTIAARRLVDAFRRRARDSVVSVAALAAQVQPQDRVGKTRRQLAPS